MTLFLGPFGLFYAGWPAAAIMIVIFIVSLAAGPVAIIFWLIAIPVSFGVIANHNKKVKTAVALGFQATQENGKPKQKSKLVSKAENGAEALKKKLKS